MAIQGSSRSRIARAPIGRVLAALGVAAHLTWVIGCASVGQVTNLSNPKCRGSLSNALESILASQGETNQVAHDLSERTLEALSSRSVGPRPFLVSSPSGVDYTFFIQPKKGVCLLRLYGRQKGFVSYTNNLTYIATRPLEPCLCSG